MDSLRYRHRRSPSSDRFLVAFSVSPPASAAGGDFNESEVLWNRDFSDSSSIKALGAPSENPSPRAAFSRQQKSGILAVLHEPDRASQVLCRKASASSLSFSSSRVFSMIPRPPSAEFKELSKSVPGTRLSLQSSAPVSVPKMSKGRKFDGFDSAGMEEEEEEVLRPHEMVPRGSGVSRATTFSVLEGAGRTLKGRDLRQVRNAVWRKTGFLD